MSIFLFALSVLATAMADGNDKPTLSVLAADQSTVIWAGGERLCIAPCTFSIAPGVHDISFTRSDMLSAKTTMDFRPGTQQYMLVKLKPAWPHTAAVSIRLLSAIGLAIGGTYLATWGDPCDVSYSGCIYPDPWGRHVTWTSGILLGGSLGFLHFYNSQRETFALSESQYKRLYRQ